VSGQFSVKIRTIPTSYSPLFVKAVILLSGGLDSSTVLYLARSEGYDCYALSFDYQQRHRQELAAAKTMGIAAGVVAHQVVNFDLRLWGGSALTDNEIALPQHRDLAQMSESIPVTYVPARNTIFLSFALAYAEAISASRVYIGVNALDYSGYPDCRPDYIDAMRSVFELGSKQGREGQPIEIITPLIDLKKTEIIQLGDRLGVPWAQTWSCYSGDRVPCGICDSCLLRLAAFAELGMVDPGMSG
jgi:7-cyano-7-deazaguanine synthase